MLEQARVQIEVHEITFTYRLCATEGMTEVTVDELRVPGVFVETRTGRDLMGLVDLRVMGQRSDFQGVLRFAIHLGCIAATGALVWLALPYWYLLVPAIASRRRRPVIKRVMFMRCCGWTSRIIGGARRRNAHKYRNRI